MDVLSKLKTDSTLILRLLELASEIFLELLHFTSRLFETFTFLLDLAHKLRENLLEVKELTLQVINLSFLGLQ